MSNRFPPLRPQEFIPRTIARRHPWISLPLPLSEICIVAALLVMAMV